MNQFTTPAKTFLVALLSLVVVGSMAAVVNAPAQATGKHRERTIHGSIGKVAGRVAASRSACRRYDPNLSAGYCYRFPNGRITWLGNYRAQNGKLFFCIDKNKDSRLPRGARRISTRNLKNQFGWQVGDKEVAALNYVISKWGEGANWREAAAIALIIREVMSDTRGQFPSHLKVGHQVANLAGAGLGRRVISMARDMWNEASEFRGPWKVVLRGPTTKLRVGESRTYKVQVRSAAGHLVPGAVVRLKYSKKLSGPKTVTTSTGLFTTPMTKIHVRASGVGKFRITASVVGPSANGKLYAPSSRRYQRGWIAEESKSGAVLTARTVFVVKAQPKVATVVSDKVVEPGVPFHDQVTVKGLPDGYSKTATARLYGPYAAQPTSTDCKVADRVAAVQFPVTGDGTFNTPNVSVPNNGYYTWVITLPGTTTTQPVTTRCGLRPETTFVTPPLIEAQLATQVSTQASGVGDALFDTIDVTGLTGHPITEPITIEWTLYGPVAPVNGSCDNVDWTQAGVVDSGSFRIATDGTYTTRKTTLKAAGCYSYGEELDATSEVAPYSHEVGQQSQTTLTHKAHPKVHTRISDHRVHVGTRLTDNIVVSGLPAGQKATVQWTLYGPEHPVHGKCRKVDWTHALVFQRGTVQVEGSGAYSQEVVSTTPRSRVIRQAGCYSYGEVLGETPTSTAKSHTPGKGSQTTLAKRYAPKVRTIASKDIAQVGTRLHDKVWVSGVHRGDRVRIQWTLYGPLKPRGTSCASLHWSKHQAAVVSRGHLTVRHNGRYRTRNSRVLHKPGCYTFAEVIQGTSRHKGYTHRPGYVSQSTLVKPRTPHHPDIPTGGSGWLNRAAYVMFGR